MTVEEAIRMIERIKDRINWEVVDSQKKMDALNMAIKSLEKETPRMVHYEADGYADGEWVYDMAECPGCGNRMTEDNDDIWDVATYCPECGQRIIWEAEDEAD